MDDDELPSRTLLCIFPLAKTEITGLREGSPYFEITLLLLQNFSPFFFASSVSFSWPAPAKITG